MSRDYEVERITAKRLDVPMKQAFGIAGGAQDVARNVLVEVVLHSGVRGWGEAAPLPAFNGETQDDALAALERAIASGRLAGADARSCRRIGELAMSSTSPSASAGCAIETAVLDAMTRAVGTSMRVLLGSAEETLRTDFTITTGTVDDAARDARAWRHFATLKIKVGGGASHDVDLDVARVLAVHEHAPDARILLDANGGLAADDAVRLVKELRSRGVVPALFEQPVAAGSWDALADVRARTKIPIALDESVVRPEDVIAAHRAGAADAINVKLMKSGIARGLDIVATTRACGFLPMIGGMVETRLAMATSACFAAGLGGFAFVDLDTPLYLAEDPFDGGLRYDGDQLDLSPIAQGHGCVPR